MKCMICGGKTLPGAKLCLPCRSALRRARDDTVSELLPLPRRLDALAYQHAHTVTGTPPRTSIAAKQKKARTTDAKQAPPSARNLPQNAWQLAALAIAVLVLAILGGMLARQSHDAHAMDTLDPRPSAPVAVDTRVSPAALAAEARNSAALPVSPTLTDVPVPPEPAPGNIAARIAPNRKDACPRTASGTCRRNGTRVWVPDRRDAERRPGVQAGCCEPAAGSLAADVRQAVRLRRRQPVRTGRVRARRAGTILRRPLGASRAVSRGNRERARAIVGRAIARPARVKARRVRCGSRRRLFSCRACKASFGT
jgi:hypothetical protein